MVHVQEQGHDAGQRQGVGGQHGDSRHEPLRLVEPPYRDSGEGERGPEEAVSELALSVLQQGRDDARGELTHRQLHGDGGDRQDQGRQRHHGGRYGAEERADGRRVPGDRWGSPAWVPTRDSKASRPTDSRTAAHTQTRGTTHSAERSQRRILLCRMIAAGSPAPTCQSPPSGRLSNFLLDKSPTRGNDSGSRRVRGVDQGREGLDRRSPGKGEVRRGRRGTASGHDTAARVRLRMPTDVPGHSRARPRHEESSHDEEARVCRRGGRRRRRHVRAAPSAQAAARDGICESGEFCLYYNSDHAGSVSDFTTSITDYGASQPECYEFKGAGAGKGQCVKNNAASVWNRTSGSGHRLLQQRLRRRHPDLRLRGQGQPQRHAQERERGPPFGGGKSPNVDMSDALYRRRRRSASPPLRRLRDHAGPSRGHRLRPGQRRRCNALLSGTVTNMVEGGTGLSTIAVYNASLDKTIIYLHTDPRSASTGDTSARGRRSPSRTARGPAAQRTRTSRCAPVARRRGQERRRPRAGQPEPESFWMARGYNVR